MGSAHERDGEGRNNIRAEGGEGERCCQITNAAAKGGATYFLKAEREQDGVRSQT